MGRDKNNPANRRVTGPLIGIEFGDNDFHRTLRAFMRLFIDSRLAENPTALTKANVVKLWNELAPGIYWLVQNGYEYDTGPDRERFMREYLTINETRVYLEQECLDYITNEPGKLNGSFCYVDVGQEQVYIA